MDGSKLDSDATRAGIHVKILLKIVRKKPSFRLLKRNIWQRTN